MEYSAVMLMIMLGLRHGFDPDHIAIIDGISVRYTVSKPKLAKWTGTLFAIGHGFIVTLVMTSIGYIGHSTRLPDGLWKFMEWVPGAVLILVGLMNLRMLTQKTVYKPHGLKYFFIPSSIKNSSNPFAIIFIGALFAMVFDTNTQATAWAYAATSQMTIWYALILGIAFSIGMITTDTLDSRILFSLMLTSQRDSSVLNYRRKLGWIIVYISLVVGSYKFLSHVFPEIELQESVLTGIGIAFFVLMSIFYAYIIYGIHRAGREKHGN
ncbi:HoxN/HupN/NixA family nickel/cobalt transporter [Pedobacter jamesrossensis]|uniref:Nickel/cobalt efflux system n=1 Tax=Pedobacter jamesrossensis TaxID=1908238 RepID=A0ABV8NJA9_9SPHI